MTFLCNMIQNLIQASKQQESWEPYHEPLEYIQFSGAEYFDTGVLGNLNTKIEAGIALASTSTDWLYVFGARGNSSTVSASTNNIDCVYGGISTGSATSAGLVCDFSNSNYATYRLNVEKANLAIDTFYDIVINKDKRQILQDGTSKGSNTNVCSDTFNSVNTITIGKVNATNLQNYGYFNGKLKYFKIDNMDLIPVLDSQMRPCLYDRVSKTFLYAKKISDGTDATSTLTYKRWNKFDVDYIESSGTQYIQLNYFPNKNTKIECCAETTDWGYINSQDTTQKSTNIFGAGTSGNQYTMGITTLSTMALGRRGGVAITGMTGALNTKYVLYQDNSGASYNDNTLTYDSTPPNVTAQTNTLTLFKNPMSDKVGSVRMYYMKVWEGSNLIRDCKPSVWHNSNTTAIACLYDEVYNKMYTNAGTGSFKAYIIGADSTVYEVGKSITNGQGAGYDLSVPYSNNFVFEAITTCKTTSSNYFMDTRKVIGSSSTSYQSDTGAFGIGGSSSGSTINWKDGTGDNVVIATNGTNWSRVQSSLPFRYNAKLVGWDETVEGVVKHKRTAVFYHFGSGNNSDRVVTNGANVANNRATVTLLYTTNSNTLSSGSDLSYIYFEQDGIVEYEVIPVRNATNTTTIGMFNRVTGSFVTKLNISGSPTSSFNALD